MALVQLQYAATFKISCFSSLPYDIVIDISSLRLANSGISVALALVRLWHFFTIRTFITVIYTGMNKLQLSYLRIRHLNSLLHFCLQIILSDLKLTCNFFCSPSGWLRSGNLSMSKTWQSARAICHHELWSCSTYQILYLAYSRCGRSACPLLCLLPTGTRNTFAHATQTTITAELSD